MSTRTRPTGRARQKARTRKDITDAAQRLRERGVALTLEQVAEEAQVSRATIYRYFSSVSALNVELGLAVQMKTPDELLDPTERDPLARMLRVHDHAFDLVRSNEAEIRAYIKSTMDHWERRGDAREPLRGARRVALVESALADLQSELDPGEYRKLIQAMSLLTFMEPFLVLKDVFELDDEEADAVMRWAITRLLAGVRASAS